MLLFSKGVNIYIQSFSLIEGLRHPVILYITVLLLLEIVIGLIIYLYLQKSMLGHLDISLSKQADLIYNFVSKSVVDLNDFKADSIYSSADELIYDLIFDAVVFNPTNSFIQVEYQNKTVFRTANLGETQISQSIKQGNKIVLYTFNNTSLSNHPIRAAYLNKGGYKIVAAFPVYLIQETLDSLIDLYFLIAPVFLILSLAGGSIISFRALNRIDKIISKTDEITTQNLNEIVEGEEYDDEYGRLV